MVRMTGADTPPILICLASLRLLCLPRTIRLSHLGFKEINMVKANDIISQCYANLTNALEKYQDNWICDKTWFRVIIACYPNVINSVGFSGAAFNCAISCRASQCGTPNDSGIFMHPFQMPCLYEGKKRKVFFYFYYSHVA